MNYRRFLRAGPCEGCGFVGVAHEFDVHHRDLDHMNDAPENLATLCRPCHVKLHSAGGSPRPKFQRDGCKSEVIQIRCSVEEKERWTLAAEARGLTLSAYVRLMVGVALAAETVPPVPEELERVVGVRAPRFVVPASCPAPNTKKSFKPDFK